MDVIGVAGDVSALYFLSVLGIGVYVLVLLTRLVKAHGRGGDLRRSHERCRTDHVRNELCRDKLSKRNVDLAE